MLVQKKQNFFLGMQADPKKVKSQVKRLKFFQNCVFFSCLCILCLLLLVQSLQCIIKYFKAPTYIASEIVPQREVGFPAITVCPTDNGYKEDVIQAHGIPKRRNYNYKYDLNWTSNQTGVTEAELFELATYRLDELVKKLSIRFFVADENGKFSVKMDLSDPKSNPNIKEQRHRLMGRCYTIYPDERIQELGVYWITIDLLQNVKLYFHRDGQFLDLSGRMATKIYIKEKVQSQIAWHDIRMLSKKKSDGTMTCIDTEYDQCIYGALIDHMKSNTANEGGCTAPWIMNGTEGTTKICKEAENINTTFWIAWNRVTNQMKDCPVPCDTLLVSLGAKNHEIKEDRDYGQVWLYFAPRAMFSEELILYNALTMFAEIGGYVGLLLGVSIWNFAAWITNILENKIKHLEKEL